MTHRQFYKLVEKVKTCKYGLNNDEQERVGEILEDFIDICEEVQQQEGCGDIFGTEGWERRVGID